MESMPVGPLASFSKHSLAAFSFYCLRPRSVRLPLAVQTWLAEEAEYWGIMGRLCLFVSMVVHVSEAVVKSENQEKFALIIHYLLFYFLLVYIRSLLQFSICQCQGLPISLSLPFSTAHSLHFSLSLYLSTYLTIYLASYPSLPLLHVLTFCPSKHLSPIIFLCFLN